MNSKLSIKILNLHTIFYGFLFDNLFYIQCIPLFGKI